MFQDREREQRRDQGERRRLEGACGGIDERGHHRRERGGGSRERERQQRVHRGTPEVGGEIAQVIRQEVLAEIAHAEEDIELGGETHDPERREGPQTHPVRPAGHRQGHRQRRGGQHQLVVDHRLRRAPEAPEAVVTGRLVAASRAGDGAGEEQHLVPSPDRDRRGEGDVGGPDAGGVAAQEEAGEPGEHQRGGTRERRRHRAAGKAVEIEDRSGAEPPEEYRMAHGEPGPCHDALPVGF